MARKPRPAEPAADPWLMRIEFKPLDELRPDPNDARTHSPAQIEAIEALLQEVGWAHPLGQADGVLVFGHARREAARNLRDRGIHIAGTPDPNFAPVVDLAHLSEAERTTLALADNRLAELAGWDTDKLITQLAGLAETGVNPGIVGFSQEDIESLIGSGAATVHVSEIPTSTVSDRFWISVRGPLAQQAQALQRLRQVMDDLPGIAVELGTISDDGDGSA